MHRFVGFQQLSEGVCLSVYRLAHHLLPEMKPTGGTAADLLATFVKGASARLQHIIHELSEHLLLGKAAWVSKNLLQARKPLLLRQCVYVNPLVRRVCDPIAPRTFREI